MGKITQKNTPVLPHEISPSPKASAAAELKDSLRPLRMAWQRGSAFNDALEVAGKILPRNGAFHRKKSEVEMVFVGKSCHEMELLMGRITRNGSL